MVTSPIYPVLRELSVTQVSSVLACWGTIYKIFKAGERIGQHRQGSMKKKDRNNLNTRS